MNRISCSDTRNIRVTAVLAGVLIFSGIAEGSESDASLIERTYVAWEETVNARDIKLWATFLAPEASFMPPDSPILESKEEILDYYRKAFADPNFSLRCEQWLVEVAKAGDMAWSTGICHATFSIPGGDKGSGSSRWFKVWLKQADGSWKCRLNTWSYL